MANLLLREAMTLEDKLRDMGESTRYDVADGDGDTDNEIAELLQLRAPPPPVWPRPAGHIPFPPRTVRPRSESAGSVHPRRRR